jgi:hypothetical protein
MKTKSIFRGLLVFIPILFIACGGGSGEVEKYELEVSSDVTVDESLQILEDENGQNPETQVTVSWSTFSLSTTLDAGTAEEQKQQLFDEITEDLTNASEAFFTDIEEELEAYNNIQAALNDMESNQLLPITSLKVAIIDTPEGALENETILTINSFTEPQDLSEEFDEEFLDDEDIENEDYDGDEDDEVEEDVDSDPDSGILYAKTGFPTYKDFTGDASYVPDHGNITVYKTGVVQTFKLDAEAVSKLKDSKTGVELKTLFIFSNSKNRSKLKCKKTSWTSNLPYKYRDTELFDLNTNPSNTRVCSIGTLQASKLKVNTLYWTWMPFTKGSQIKNPIVQAQWSPTEPRLYNEAYSKVKSRLQKYGFVGRKLNTAMAKYSNGLKGILTRAYSYYLCKYSTKYGPYCRFTRSDMPIEYLVQYKYKNAGNKTVGWTKN